MFSLSILILAAVLPIEAYVRANGNLNIDQAQVSVRGRANFSSLKDYYPLKDTDGEDRTFDLNGKDGKAVISGKWQWRQINGKTIEGVLECTGRKDMKLHELAPYISFPMRYYSESLWEANGRKTGLENEDFFRRDNAREIIFHLDDKRKLILTMESESAVKTEDFRKWTESWIMRFGLVQRGRDVAKGDIFRIKFRLSSPSGIKLHQFKNYTLSENDCWVRYEHSKDFSAGSALDFSEMGLQDAPSGKYGWLKADNGRFFFEGRPEIGQKFCGANLCQTANYLTHELADTLIDRFVRLGYNAIRIHHHDKYLPDPENWDRLDYLVAKGVEKGIYFTTDMYVSRPVKYSEIGLEGDQNLSKGLYKNLVPIYEPAFEDWCNFSRMFFEHVNPYTGRAYKDEPALALISLINESKLSGYKELNDPVLQEAWIKFGGEGKLTRKSKGYKDFEVYLHKQTYEKCSKFLRSIGVKALFTTDNNGHFSKETSGANGLYDYLDDHFYIDHPRFLRKKWSLPRACNNTNTVYTGGPGILKKNGNKATKPWVVTEWNYCSPNRYRSLAGLMTGAKAATGGMDGLWRFTYSHSLKDISYSGANSPTTFNLATDPINAASERATICLFLRGDLSDSNGIREDKENGTLTVTSDKTCGVFAYSGEMKAGPLTATVKDAPASLWVSSLDGEAISRSSRMLLVHLTDIQGDGATFLDCFRDVVLSWGKGCLIEKGSAEVSLKLEQPRDYEIWELAGDGHRVRLLKAKIKDGKLNFNVSTDGPSGGRIYYEIVKK